MKKQDILTIRCLIAAGKAATRAIKRYEVARDLMFPAGKTVAWAAYHLGKWETYRGVVSKHQYSAEQDQERIVVEVDAAYRGSPGLRPREFRCGCCGVRNVVDVSLVSFQITADLGAAVED